jgi:hypothetical protein
MQFDAGLIGDAAALAREHGAVLARLPATVQAFVLVELQKWPTLFGAEQRYQRALLLQLSRGATSDLVATLSDIARVEEDAGIGKIAHGDPARFQDDAQALLRKHRLVSPWRSAVDRLFQQIQPAIETELYPPDAPRRLIVQIYGANIAMEPDTIWSRFKRSGARVPLDLTATRSSQDFLTALFGASPGTVEPAFFAAAQEAAGHEPLDVWMIESHEALHALWDRNSMRGPGMALTALSYDRLAGYRNDLMRALYSKIQSGVESPQAFAAYARSLRLPPRPGALSLDSDLLQAFVRDTLLSGNGTLIVNNTFVEWAAAQALRRAQPRILVTRFGVRDKFKPFASMLLFSQARPTDQMPAQPDPAGSFVDVEQLSYYVWLNAEKSAAYRGRTLYLFLAEGVDWMLAIRSDKPEARTELPPASLADVRATMLEWLGIRAGGADGRAIPLLVG